ncbi:MAG: hypothetical protein R3185_00070 [Candidatus Thermoplasmatota archaeon]|nr:hypothetical protein [Candidatus Thermoplasmatota archaeon]
MSKLAALALVAALTLAALPVHAEDRELPGAYPAVLVDLLDELLATAEEDAWPTNRGVHPNATHVLEAAQEDVEKGRLSDAINRYVAFRTENAVQHLLDDVADRTPDQGRSLLGNATNQLRNTALAATDANRGIVNRVDADALSVRGAEAALWGAQLVGRGELQLNLLPRVTGRDIYQNNTPDANLLRQRVALTLGAMDHMNIGGSIASVAKEIPGPTLAEGEITARLDEIASGRLAISPNSDLIKYLPRGDASRDNAVLRAGLFLVSAEQIKGEDFRRMYLDASKRGSIGATLNQVMATDRGDLRPWATRGSALALASFESVDMDLPDSLTQPKIQEVIQNRSFVRSTLDAEAILAPEDSELDATPLPGVLALLALACVASLRRRSP